MHALSARPKALFLTAESPYPLIGGGALRSASVLEYFLARYETDVICFMQPGAPDPFAIPSSASALKTVRNWTAIQLPVHGNSNLSRGIRNGSRFLRGAPPLVDRFAGFEKQMGAALAGQTYDVGVMEHLWCAPYVSTLRPHCRRMVLDLHNIESDWHRRSATVSGFPANLVHRRFAAAALAIEREIIPKFDLILVTSQPECHSVSKWLEPQRVIVVKNTAPYSKAPSELRRDEIVFSGNMEYAPNWMAARHFSREIWPSVMSQRPKTRWNLVGKAADGLKSILETNHRVGFVSDPEDAMIEIARASVAVVPLLVGTGTRLKIVEAWASGTPVVSTSLGAEGLDCEPGRDLIIANRPPEFAEAVVHLLEDPALASEIGANGRKRFETAYTWESAWEALAACNL